MDSLYLSLSLRFAYTAICLIFLFIIALVIVVGVLLPTTVFVCAWGQGGSFIFCFVCDRCLHLGFMGFVVPNIFRRVWYEKKNPLRIWFIYWIVSIKLLKLFIFLFFVLLICWGGIAFNYSICFPKIIQLELVSYGFRRRTFWMWKRRGHSPFIFHVHMCSTWIYFVLFFRKHYSSRNWHMVRARFK